MFSVFGANLFVGMSLCGCVLCVCIVYTSLHGCVHVQSWKSTMVPFSLLLHPVFWCRVSHGPRAHFLSRLMAGELQWSTFCWAPKHWSYGCVVQCQPLCRRWKWALRCSCLGARHFTICANPFPVNYDTWREFPELVKWMAEGALLFVGCGLALCSQSHCWTVDSS